VEAADERELGREIDEGRIREGMDDKDRDEEDNEGGTVGNLSKIGLIQVGAAEIS
jgi:hypothetical protein